MQALGGFSPVEWLVLFERELLLFAGAFFLIGAIDELLVDGCYLWLRLTGRLNQAQVDRSVLRNAPLAGVAAVFIPTWREAEVIGATVANALAAWPQSQLRLYVGVYRNDPETLQAVMTATGGDPRLRLVVHDTLGPTTKADCLNRLYAALSADEARWGQRARMILLHDAEDMVDPAALGLQDAALDHAEFVQLPVVPVPVDGSRWISGHYCEEFAEAHGKALVVRDAIAAALPAAGVGCAFSRELIGRLAQEPGRAGTPFSVESLTEDYELGMRVKYLGGRSRFLRLRGEDGRLIATRACFPATLDAAVRQKSRWIHGIALQSWERLGWSWNPIEMWMRMHDRRGPLTALVLFSGYLLLAVGGLHLLAAPWLPKADIALDPMVECIVWINIAAFAWRLVWRFGFTASEYGWKEGGMAILRVPLANVIAIMAGRRALFAYIRTLNGNLPRWEKTSHADHPVLMGKGEVTL